MASTMSLHFEKHKKDGVSGLGRHVERVPGQKHSNKNIRDEDTSKNIFLIKDNLTYSKRIDAIIERRYTGKKAIRKDAVVLVGTTVQIGGDLVNASLDAQVAFLQEAFEQLKLKFGADNFVSGVIHLDETTPHLHADFVPLTDDGRLSAKDVLGGRAGLKQIQEDFLNVMNSTQNNVMIERKGGVGGLSQKEFEKMKEIEKTLRAEQAEKIKEFEEESARALARLEIAQKTALEEVEEARRVKSRFEQERANLAQERANLEQSKSEVEQSKREVANRENGLNQLFSNFFAKLKRMLATAASRFPERKLHDDVVEVMQKVKEHEQEESLDVEAIRAGLADLEALAEEHGLEL